MIVKIAVDKIPRPRVYFPPNFSDKIPPLLMTMKAINFKILQIILRKKLAWNMCDDVAPKESSENL
jgi:hypothetical protein